MTENNTLRVALELAGLGYPVLPVVALGKRPACQHGASDASREENRIREWFACGSHNLGVACNDLVVLDVDSTPDGRPGLPEHLLASLMEQAGAVARTPTGGMHFWFARRRGERQKIGRRPDEAFDVKAGPGTYVVVPPSIRVEGDYEWLRYPCELAQLPDVPEWISQWLADRPGNRQEQPSTAAEDGLIHEGRRNSALISVAGTLRRLGLGEAQIADVLRAVNECAFVSPVEDREVTQVARSASRYQSLQEGVRVNRLSAEGLAEAWVSQHKVDGIPTTWWWDAFKCWIVWSQSGWRVRSELDMLSDLQDFAKLVYDQAAVLAAEQKEKERAALNGSENTRTGSGNGKSSPTVRDGMSPRLVANAAEFLRRRFHIASDEPYLLWRRSQWEPVRYEHPPILVPNGRLVWNTETGSFDLEPLQPQHLSVHILNVPYDATAGESQLFSELVTQVAGSHAAVAFAWLATLLAPIHNPRFAIFAGDGANGKTALLTAIQAVLGEHNYVKCSLPTNEQRFAWAEIGYRLLAVCEEAGSFDRVASTRIKELTDGGKVLVERKYHQPEMTQVRARLAITTNEEPRFPDASYGLARRALLFHSTYRVPEDRRDSRLLNPKWWLDSGEAVRVLNSLVARLAASYRGEGVPLHSTTLTTPLVTPLDDWLDSDAGITPASAAVRLPKHEVYKAYAAWAKESGITPLNQSWFWRWANRVFEQRNWQCRLGGVHAQYLIGATWNHCVRRPDEGGAAF